MTKALTIRSLDAIKPAKDRREIPDALLPGLYFIVQPSGAKSWAIRYRHGGRSRKHTLGPYPAIDLRSAREMAGKALRAVAEGRDPGHEKQEAMAGPADSVEQVVSRFIERHCKRNYRPRTLRDTERYMRRYVLPRWRNRSVGSITRANVRELLEDIIHGGAPVEANRVFSSIRKLFNWCLEHEIIAASPLAGMKLPTAESSRDHLVSDDELRLIWRATAKLGYPFGSTVQLLILTGQRRGEVAGMEWSELDLENRLWSLPRERVKNDTAHDVPLSEQAIAIIEQAPRIGDRYVFTTNGEQAVSDFSKNKRRLDALLPPTVRPWTLHDLRRTVASGMARLGINLPVIEKCLNHTSGSFAGIVGIYQRHTFGPEKRHAFETWGAFIDDLISDRPRQNIVRLNAEAR